MKFIELHRLPLQTTVGIVVITVALADVKHRLKAHEDFDLRSEAKCARRAALQVAQYAPGRLRRLAQMKAKARFEPTDLCTALIALWAFDTHRVCGLCVAQARVLYSVPSAPLAETAAVNPNKTRAARTRKSSR